MEWKRVLESLDAEDARRLLKLVRARLKRDREAKLDAMLDELYVEEPATAVASGPRRLVQEHTESGVLRQLHGLAKTEDRRALLRVANARLEQLAGYESKRDPLEDPVDAVLAAGWAQSSLDSALEEFRGEKRLKKAFWAVTKGIRPSVHTEFFDPAYWEKLSDGALLVAGAVNSVGVNTLPEATAAGVRCHVGSHGYFRHQSPLCWDCSPKVQLDAIKSTLQRLVAAGWPPSFIFVYHEPWRLLERLWPYARAVLGEDCVLEPSSFAWVLRQQESGTFRKYVGGNFGLPHRDYPAAESCRDDGSVQALSLWVPLTYTDEHNGCMMAVPWERDGLVHDTDHADHMRAAVSSMVGTQSISFPVDAATPLRGAPGDIMGWAGNTVHWGSRCSMYASQPRISLATAFRTASSAAKGNPNWALPPIQQHQVLQLSFEQRLEYIAHSTLLYTSWFNLSKNTCPSVFWDAFSSEE